MPFRSGKQTVGNRNRARFEFGQMKEKELQLRIRLAKITSTNKLNHDNKKNLKLPVTASQLHQKVRFLVFFKNTKI